MLYQFIVYACPTGELAENLTKYFAKSRELAGENTAHKYMPHCTLTGFFTDELSSVPFYLQALSKAYLEAQNDLSLNITITDLAFSENWHGLELQSNSLKQLISNFARLEQSPTRQEPLRLKDWLHLSLAYNFNPEDREQLKDLAREIINIQAEVNWELRFYQKNPDWTWKCWQSWVLS
ncbi:hypothetical protein IQ255_28120 [Pleurocapsales cyanobacterium LEGE 10410]|nr:hypothetical protein [Pleurocapsales cyanobacterium LEGE 10410]